ncbi:MAG TPA: GNAT family N-acetyltransferase, partial [Asticcacaulis sp.]|nr:GNAT family N-acetyltransferase [Asticcacaulis sp.]
MIMHNEPQRAFIAPQRPEHISVETTRLSLTALKDADLDAVMAVFADKNSARMTHAIPHPLERGEAEALLTQMSATPFTHWAIRLDDEHLIGIISLTKSACGTSGGIHSFGPNLSVFIAPAYQGQGYAIEATDGLL